MRRTVNECLVRLTCDWRKSECHRIMSARCDVILKETIDGLAIFVTLCVSRFSSPWLSISNLMRKINHLTESIYWSTLSETEHLKMLHELYFILSEQIWWYGSRRKLFVWMTVVHRKPKYEEVASYKKIITRYKIDSNLGLPMKDYILNYNFFYSSLKVILTRFCSNCFHSTI